MTVRIYAYYGLLAHEGSPKMSTYRDPSAIYDVWECEIPEWLEPYHNDTDEPCVIYDERRYRLNEVLGQKESVPHLRLIDRDGKFKWLKLDGRKL